MTNTLAPPRAAIARAEHATKVYGSGETAVRAIDDVTVEFAAGRFTAIMGPSGSGKSTLMHCAAGLDDLTSGEVFVGDVALGSLSDKELTLLRRDRIGFVFQSYNLIPTLTALENITLPTALAGKKPNREWLDDVIDTVGLSDRRRVRLLGMARPSGVPADSSRQASSRGPRCSARRCRCNRTRPTGIEA